MSEPVPEAECPTGFTGLEVSHPKESAAGLTAVAVSMKHVWGEAGVRRGTYALYLLNQKEGFDCPSCAWPDPDGERSVTEFCENGAKAVAWEADKRLIPADYFREHSVDDLAKQTDYELGRLGRLAEPYVLRPGSRHYEPLPWDEAIAEVARHLKALRSPDEALFYTSGRASNEAAFLYQLFARRFGTNNLPDCSNMCHESSGAALGNTLGIGKGTVKLDDFEKAEVILILGQNPGTNHPRMLTTLQAAKRAGAKIIAVNPLREAGLLGFKNPQEVRGMLGFPTPLADEYYRVKVGGDQALLKGVAKVLFDRGAIDWDFVNGKTDGVFALRANLDSVPWYSIEEQSGLPRAEIERLAGVLGKSGKIIACWAMGLTQHPHAVATIRDLVNVLLLRGSVGKPGAGVCPVRGHSNVQGDRTVGIYEKPSKAFLDALEAEFGFPPPRHPGHDTVSAIGAMRAGTARVFFALGGNFLSATPDTQYTARALKNCDLTAQVSIKLNRSHLVTGRTALILPCLGRTEIDRTGGRVQFVTTENSMGVVQASRGGLEPASPNLKSEVEIVCALAHAALGPDSGIPWPSLAADYDRVRDRIARVVPGFDDYNARARRPGGFYLPNKPRDGTFPTATGKARFSASPLTVLRVGPGQLVMMTVRSHDQFNTTVYGLDDRYRGIKSERRVVLMHPDDLAERNLKAGQAVTLTSHFRGTTRTATPFLTVAYDVPRGCCATYFPEANGLVPVDSVAAESRTPTSKWVAVTVAAVG